MSVAKLHEIEQLIGQLDRNEQLLLIERIVERLRQSQARPLQPLYGAWKGKFPEDTDIDKVLEEIRSTWIKDLEEPDK